MRTIVSPALLLAFLVLPAQSQDRGHKFEPRQVIPPVRAITDATISNPTEMAHPVAASDLVIGLTIGTAARAYPINMLTGPRREIINDELGGRAIAATW